MKMSFVVTVSAFAVALLLDTGCAEDRSIPNRQASLPPNRPPPQAPVLVAINDAPPPPQIEVVASSNDPDRVWVPGNWVWRGNWVWVGGRWTTVPHPQAAWIPGHWVHHDEGWVFIHGYWR